MTDKENLKILVVNPLYFPVPVLERLKVIKFIKECPFAPREVKDIFVQYAPKIIQFRELVQKSELH
ncbi:MAG: hypothetical protein ABR903_00630 [Thermodesulfovibrionales bacterium]|jgi:hypothetical protein